MMARRFLTDLAVLPGGSALPSNPVDGECYLYNTGVPNFSVLWWLRWSTYWNAQDGRGWMYLGGPPLTSFNNTADSISATAMTITANCPSITVPLAGIYNCECGASMRNNTVSQWSQLLVARNGVSTGVSLVEPNSSGTPLAVNRSLASAWQLAGLAAGDVIALGLNVSGGNGGFAQKFLRLTPFRVG